jgi:hypothetical protein
MTKERLYFEVDTAETTPLLVDAALADRIQGGLSHIMETTGA